jgi:hypothetical protein
VSGHCSEDTILAGLLTTIVIFLIAIFSYIFFTDEYEIKEQVECVAYSVENGQCSKQEKTYSCNIQHGETLRICKDLAECNNFCEQMRNR